MMKKIKKYVIIMNPGNKRLPEQPEGPLKRPRPRPLPLVLTREEKYGVTAAHDTLNEKRTKNMIHNTYRINKDKLRPIGRGSQSIVFKEINDDRYIYKVIDPNNLQRAFEWNSNTISRFIANYCSTQSELKTHLEENPMINLVPNEKCSVVSPGNYILIKEPYIKDAVMFSEVINILHFKLILEILIQIIYTIGFLYHYRIYHNDLNFGNILLVENIDKIPLPYNETIIPTYIVKIIDYGLMTHKNPLTRIFRLHENEQRPFCDLCYIFALLHRYRSLEDKDILDSIFNPICGEFINLPEMKSTREILGGLYLKNKSYNCNRVNKSVDFNATIETLIMRVLEQWRITPSLNS